MKNRKVGSVNDKGEVWVCTPYITVKGRKVYPKNSKVFCFWAKPKK